jgi:hypothetical protein
MTDTEKQLLEKVLVRINKGLYDLESDISEGEEITDEMRTEWEEGYLSGIRITATTIEMIINGEIELEQQPADSK